MAILFLITAMIYCLIHDFIIKISTSIKNKQQKRPQQTYIQRDRAITQNELLTFEELLEDD